MRYKYTLTQHTPCCRVRWRGCALSSAFVTRQQKGSFLDFSCSNSVVYLLFTLVFSSCSFCLRCHSSSSSFAFSFHSTSCVRELASEKQQRNISQPQMKCFNILRITSTSLLKLPSSSSLSRCSSLHFLKLSGSACNRSTLEMAAYTSEGPLLSYKTHTAKNHTNHSTSFS